MSLPPSDETLPQYRSVSWAAVLAFALALLSAVAVFNPLFVVVAIAAAALSLYALRSINLQPDILSGRGWAQAALFVAVFFMIFAPARMGMRSWVLQRHGRDLAEAFLRLLQEEKTFDAHQLSNLKYRSPTQQAELDVDPNKLTSEDFRGFEQTPTIQSIKRIDHKFDFYLEAIEPSRTYSEMEIFVFRYRLVPHASTGRKPFYVWLRVGRHIDRRSGTPTWKLMDMQHVFKEDMH